MALRGELVFSDWGLAVLNNVDLYGCSSDANVYYNKWLDVTKYITIYYMYSSTVLQYTFEVRATT